MKKVFTIFGAVLLIFAVPVAVAAEAGPSPSVVTIEIGIEVPDADVDIAIPKQNMMGLNIAATTPSPEPPESVYLGMSPTGHEAPEVKFSELEDEYTANAAFDADVGTPPEVVLLCSDDALPADEPGLDPVALGPDTGRYENTPEVVPLEFGAVPTASHLSCTRVSGTSAVKEFPDLRRFSAAV